MNPYVHRSDPPLGIGLAAVIFGALGLFMFFLPILSIPLGVAGLMCGLCSVVPAWLRGWVTLRWSVAGLVLSGLAVAVGVAIARAPAGYLPVRTVPLDQRAVPERPFVSPPARPFFDSRAHTPRQGLERHRAGGSHARGSAEHSDRTLHPAAMPAAVCRGRSAPARAGTGIRLATLNGFLNDVPPARSAS